MGSVEEYMCPSVFSSLVPKNWYAQVLTAFRCDLVEFVVDSWIWDLIYLASNLYDEFAIHW